LNRFRPSSVGLAFGLFTAIFHLAWAILVWLGVAQALIDFIFHLHMIKPPYTIEPFSLATATGLVVVTGCLGYAFGWLLAVLWNRLAARS
jgi:hypothetical protein